MFFLPYLVPRWLICSNSKGRDLLLFVFSFANKKKSLLFFLNKQAHKLICYSLRENLTRQKKLPSFLFEANVIIYFLRQVSSFVFILYIGIILISTLLHVFECIIIGENQPFYDFLGDWYTIFNPLNQILVMLFRNFLCVCLFSCSKNLEKKPYHMSPTFSFCLLKITWRTFR